MNGNLAYEEDWGNELIGGKIVAMSPAAMNHVLISGNIYRIFSNHLEGKRCVPIPDNANLYLTETDRFSPDFMIVCDRSKLKSDGVHGAPDLVVEVLSRSTMKRDKTSKKEVYERCGVPEYWLVSPEQKSVEVYWLDAGKYVLREIYMQPADWELKNMTDEEKGALVTEFKCRLYDDLAIRLEDVFQDLV